jgi:hypothetical protein
MTTDTDRRSPSTALLDLMIGSWVSQAISVAARLGPHPNLKVTLSVQRRANVAQVRARDDALAAVTNADAGDAPLFIVSPVKFAYEIDYAPTHPARCVAPPEVDATS